MGTVELIAEVAFAILGLGVGHFIGNKLWEREMRYRRREKKADVGRSYGVHKGMYQSP